jgi:nucleotide-binding universal stress UspA family protein
VNYLPSPTEAIETGDEAAAVMDTELRRACRAGLASVEGHLKRGCPDAVVAALAESINAGIIVVGSRGNGPLKRVLLGSVAETLVRSAPCPVLVCRGGALYWPGTHVVAGDDLSDDALRAAIWAGRLSRALELPLRLTHVRPPGKARRQLDGLSGARRLLHERAQQVYLATGVWPIPDVVLGAPASALRDAAYADGRAGIIVVGRRGHRALSRLVLGRVSMDVLRAAMGPVMVVPAGSSQ